MSIVVIEICACKSKWEIHQTYDNDMFQNNNTKTRKTCGLPNTQDTDHTQIHD